MRTGKINFCGRVIETFSDHLSGRSLKNMLGINKDRNLIQKEVDGSNTIIGDNQVINIPKNKELFLDDLPTLREGSHV